MPGDAPFLDKENVKIDIVMWTKNSARYLDRVLPQIDEVLGDIVNRKIAIDGRSADDTRKLLEKYGWEVHISDRGGIGVAANQALSMVSTPFFASFEADVILSPNWLQVFSYFDEITLCVRGERYSNIPVLYQLEKREHRVKLAQISLDNNLWNTNLLKKIGGFPYREFFKDRIIRDRAQKAGLKWVDVESIESVHLRNTLTNELKHDLIASKESYKISDDRQGILIFNFLRILYSPIRALKLFAKENFVVDILYFYPIKRFVIFLGNCLGALESSEYYRVT